MNVIQESLRDAKDKREIERQQKLFLDEIYRVEEEEIQQIKDAIAETLKRQYLAIVQGENQMLGDVRDKDIIDREILTKNLDQII